ncbi:hypothetical protein ABT095_29555 [Kitasatospora sp. NPDC002227]|uniref:hypothetical protein n=1 Tax=Kitasatospora sp. NPDC002227 TaxID=3154773 RepID=UPI00332822E1
MHVRRSTSYAITAGIAAAVALLSSCSAGGAEFTAGASDITGIWKNANGAQFSFNPDGTFTAQRVTKALPLPGGCADVLGAGKWRFLNTGTAAADSRPDATVQQSSWLTLDPPGSREVAAACGIQAGIHKDSDGVSLCMVIDPDQTCSSDELLRRTKS